MLCEQWTTRLLVLAMLASPFLVPAKASAEIYELRTYTTHEGKLDDLNARFRDYTVELFKKHGMESVGYWVPADEPKSTNTLIYLLRHESRDAARKSWSDFLADPQWQAAHKASEADGPILAKRPESVYLKKTDYSPSFSSSQASGDAVYELRIYKTNEGKLDDLNARFRDHTIGLFKQHGMQSVGYWVPTEEPQASSTLIYLLRHESREGARNSWRSFGSDPQWRKVAEESQKDGRFLSERPEAIYLKATDYSSLR